MEPHREILVGKVEQLVESTLVPRVQHRHSYHQSWQIGIWSGHCGHLSNESGLYCRGCEAWPFSRNHQRVLIQPAHGIARPEHYFGSFSDRQHVVVVRNRKTSVRRRQNTDQTGTHGVGITSSNIDDLLADQVLAFPAQQSRDFIEHCQPLNANLNVDQCFLQPATLADRESPTANRKDR